MNHERGGKHGIGGQSSPYRGTALREDHRQGMFAWLMKAQWCRQRGTA